MSEAEAELSIPIAKARTVAPKKRRKLKDNWWRHAVGLIGIVVSLFPLVFVISSAFNRDNTLQGAELIPVARHDRTTSPISCATTSPTRAAASPTRPTCTGSSTR